MNNDDSIHSYIDATPKVNYVLMYTNNHTRNIYYVKTPIKPLDFRFGLNPKQIYFYWFGNRFSNQLVFYGSDWYQKVSEYGTEDFQWIVKLVHVIYIQFMWKSIIHTTNKIDNSLWCLWGKVSYALDLRYSMSLRYLTGHLNYIIKSERGNRNCDRPWNMQCCAYWCTI